MNAIVFLSLIVSTIIGIIIPIIILISLIITKKVKIIPIIKGIFMYIIMNAIILPIALMFFIDILAIESMASVKMFVGLIFYAFINVVLQYFVFNRIFNISKEKDLKKSYALGYGLGFGYILAKACFQNLMIGDHLRGGNIDFILDMGISESSLQSLTQLYNISHVTYFLAVGLSVILIVLLQLVLVDILQSYMENENKISFIFATVVMIIMTLFMYMGTYVDSFILFTLVILLLIGSIHILFRAPHRS